MNRYLRESESWDELTGRHGSIPRGLSFFDRLSMRTHLFLLKLFEVVLLRKCSKAMSEDNGEDNSRFPCKGLEEIAEDLKQEPDGWDGVSRVGCLASTVNRQLSVQGAFTQVILYNPWRHLL